MNQQLRNITTKHVLSIGKKIHSIFVAYYDSEESIEVKFFPSFDDAFSCGKTIEGIKVIFEDSSWSKLEKVGNDFVWQYRGHEF